jgi:hypothetical protein
MAPGIHKYSVRRLAVFKVVFLFLFHSKKMLVLFEPLDEKYKKIPLIYVTITLIVHSVVKLNKLVFGT